MLTTVKITKGKALLNKTIKIADGTMSVKTRCMRSTSSATSSAWMSMDDDDE